MVDRPQTHTTDYIRQNGTVHQMIQHPQVSESSEVSSPFSATNLWKIPEFFFLQYMDQKICGYFWSNFTFKTVKMYFRILQKSYFKQYFVNMKITYFKRGVKNKKNYFRDLKYYFVWVEFIKLDRSLNYTFCGFKSWITDSNHHESLKL